MQEYDGHADAATVTALRRIAVHVVARARHQAGGRFSLRVTPGGFGTPDLPDGRRVRVAGPTLVVESDAPDAAVSRSMAIPRASLAGLAHLAGVRLASPLDVGADTPTTGPIGVPIVIDADGITAICRWFELSAGILDRVVTGLPHKTAQPSLVRLWPEHFDVAVDLLARDGVRTNIGASPGRRLHRRALPVRRPVDRRPPGWRHLLERTIRRGRARIIARFGRPRHRVPPRRHRPPRDELATATRPEFDGSAEGLPRVMSGSHAYETIERPMGRDDRVEVSCRCI